MLYDQGQLADIYSIAYQVKSLMFVVKAISLHSGICNNYVEDEKPVTIIVAQIS